MFIMWLQAMTLSYVTMSLSFIIYDIAIKLWYLKPCLAYFLLTNSANIKCCPFQVKINCSKFIIRLSQWCHITFLVYLFATSRNLLFGVFLPGKIITVLQKKTLQISGKCQRKVGTFFSKGSGMFWQNFLKVAVKKLNLKKPCDTHELLQKWFLRFLSPIYLSTYLHKPVCVLYSTHILYLYSYL